MCVARMETRLKMKIGLEITLLVILSGEFPALERSNQVTSDVCTLCSQSSLLLQPAYFLESDYAW